MTDQLIATFNDPAIATATDGEWLIAQLRQSLELSVAHVIRIAAIIRRLEELDIPITIELAPLPFLRKIAHGNLSPELYVAFEGRRAMLEKAGSLPTPDQERIARNPPMKVMELNGDFRMVPPLSMTNREIQQVFAIGRLRNETEQVGWLRERMASDRLRLAAIDAEAPVELDRKRGGVVVNGKFLSATEMAQYLAELSKPRR